LAREKYKSILLSLFDPEIELAEQYFRYAVECDPTDIFSLSMYGVFLIQLGHQKLGIKYLIKAFEQNPYWNENTMQLCKQSYDYPKVKSILDKVLRKKKPVM